MKDDSVDAACLTSTLDLTDTHIFSALNFICSVDATNSKQFDSRSKGSDREE